MDFLENGVLWNHPTCTAASFLDYLNVKLARKEEALAFEKQTLDTSRQIAIQLLRIRSFCRLMDERLQNIVSQTPSQSQAALLDIDLGIYHTKNVDDVFLRWPADSDRSFGYMWRVYDLLDGLIVAVLPLRVANLNEGDDSHGRQVVIFPLLERGFAMGVPSDRQLFDQYLVKLKEAIGKIHAVGVIHVDLYPSNILWRHVDAEIVVRIVDWDCVETLLRRLCKIDYRIRRIQHTIGRLKARQNRNVIIGFCS